MTTIQDRYGPTGRMGWLAQRYARYLTGSVLDVGCGHGDLRLFLPRSASYCGVDIGGAPDVVVDLECGTLPFGDRSWDCVVCADVLQYVDALHRIFDELLRVSRRYVIVSLANGYNTVLPLVLTGRTVPENTPGWTYGLPTDFRPLHHRRWWFSYTDAERFVRERAGRHGARVVEQYAFRVDGRRWQDIVKRILMPVQERRYNTFAMTSWTVLEVKP